MRHPDHAGPARERGIALLVSLIFLLVITLLAISAVRFTTAGVRSSLNEESRVSSFVTAQSVVDGTITLSTNTPVLAGVGQVYCTPNVGCANQIITLPAGDLSSKLASGVISAQAVRRAPEFAPPPRGSGASVNKFFAATFVVTGTHDETASGQGRTQINEGLILILNRN